MFNSQRFSLWLLLLVFALSSYIFVKLFSGIWANVIVYNNNTAIEDDLRITTYSLSVLKDSSILLVDGNFVVDGRLECADGPLTIVVNGLLIVNGEIICYRDGNIDDIGMGVNIVARGGAQFGEDSVVLSNGHMQLVDSVDKLIVDDEELKDAFDDFSKYNGGLSIGPFLPFDSEFKYENGKDFSDLSLDSFGLKDEIKFSGVWVAGDKFALSSRGIIVPEVPNSIDKVLLNFDFSENLDVSIDNWDVFIADGHVGKDDIAENCYAEGGDGGEGAALRLHAYDLQISDLSLYLGDGGPGGKAVTSRDCDVANAFGGGGGLPGTFKLVSYGILEVVGKMEVIIGRAGDGGDAFSYGVTGKGGCPGSDGGAALAVGGNGGMNVNGAVAVGKIDGMSHIYIGDIIGGNGGYAESFGGNGGDGESCGCDGADGGNARAFGGKGGDADSRNVVSRGGNGGDAMAFGGFGGLQGVCENNEKRGKSGIDGKVEAAGGLEGKGRDYDGLPGGF